MNNDTTFSFNRHEPDRSEWWEDRITSGLDAHPKFTDMALEWFCNLDREDMAVDLLTGIEEQFKCSDVFEAMIEEARATGVHPWNDDRSNVVSLAERRDQRPDPVVIPRYRAELIASILDRADVRSVLGDAVDDAVGLLLGMPASAVSSWSRHPSRGDSA